VLATVGSTAQVTLTSDISRNARGAFDILVRPAATTNLQLAQTRGLVEPNYLSFTGKGGITLEQWQQTRTMSGVAVAAPVSVVGQVTASWTTPAVKLPSSSTSRLYELTFTQRVFDGISNRVVATQEMRALLPGSPDVPGATSIVTAPLGGDAANGWFVFGAPLPPITSSVVAVDPTAEEQLLGHRVPALSQLAEIRSRSAGTFTARTLNDVVASAVENGEITDTEGLAPSLPMTSTIPVIPVIVTATDPATSTLSVQASVVAEGAAVDRALQGSNAGSVLQSWPVGERPLSTQSKEVSTSGQPLAGTPLSVDFGGPAGDAGAGGAITQLSGVLIGRPSYRAQAPSDGRVQLLLEPLGLVPATGPKVAVDVDPRVGIGTMRVDADEVKYRAVTQIEAAGSTGLYPIRTFDPAALIPTSSDQGRVSLGVYDVPPLVVDHSPLARAGTVLRPTFNTAGLVVRPPAAIADIRDAQQLRGAAPIDAIRVRVAGISTFDVSAQHKVEQIASSIASLGLKVDVVIGSSPQEVSITVPEYVTALNRTVPLGEVTQRWTTMGAASTVRHGLSQTSIALVAIGAAAAVGAALSAQLLEGAAARRDAAILQVMGWSRRRVRTRMLTAPTIASAISLLAFVITWGATAKDPTMGTLGLAICLLVPISAAFASWAATRGAVLGAARTGDAAGARFRPRITARVVFALRLLLAAPARSAALAALLVVSTAAIGFAAAAFAARAATAGPTLLARALVEALASEHLTLLIVVIVVCAVFILLLWRFLQRRRAAEDRVLATVGWSHRERSRLVIAMLAWLVIPAVIVGILVGATLSFTLDTPLPLTAAAAGAAGGLSIAALMALQAFLRSGAA